ncbi:MAG TPA: chromosomal replication initiator protein DnaA [Phycisphaerales bacterium]|nr:chromosomal replication initiator protein DnaA [Phycisphaerales bacterium]
MQSTITDEPLRSTETLVQDINDAISREIGQQKFRIWFKNSARLSLVDGYLKVGVPNLFIAHWVESHFARDIARAAATVAGHTVKVSFAIDPDLAGRQQRTELDSQAGAVNTSAARRGAKAAKSADGGNALRLTLETFIVGSSNELAFNAARAVVNEEKSPFNPLFIHGGYGVGKTHLLQGICNAVRLRRPQTQWLYLSAEEFSNQFVLALKTKKLEAFRRRMRQTDLLAIDDIHFLAGKPSIQEEFLHTFNSISLVAKQVVLVSDAHPKMIGELSEKLVNRFVSGMVVKIDSPDLKTRMEICRQYADTIAAGTFGGRRGRSEPAPSVPDSVIKFIAENLRSNVRELEGALLKLIAFASLQDERITLAMAHEVLSEHLARTDPIVHISDIESTVATYFGITPANIHSAKKDRTVALARHFSMYLTRKHTRMSSSEIGRFMGGKNHATVLLACQKIEDLVQRNAEVNWTGPTGNRVARAAAVLAQLEQSVAS